MMRGEHDTGRHRLAGDEELRAGPLSEAEVHAADTIDLARKLVERAQLLVRSEIELARAELRTDVRRGLIAGGLAGGAGLCLVAALSCGLIAAVLAIGAAVLSPVWVGIVGAALFATLAVGLGLFAAGEGKSARPERSLRQVRRTAEWIRRPVTP